MTWVDEHIEWLAGLVIAAATGVIGFFARLARSDRRGVMTRLKAIEGLQVTHTAQIGTLEQEVREAEVEATDDRNELFARLDRSYEERRRESEAIHNRITELFGGIKRIEGRLEGLRGDIGNRQ